MKIQSAQPFKNNPRKISEQQRIDLADSMLRLGDISGLVFNLRSCQWVGGNRRSEVIGLNVGAFQIEVTEQYTGPDQTGTIALGYIAHKGSKFAVRVVDWDEATESEANIAANKKGGEWDMQILKTSWDKEILKMGGFSDLEIKDIFKKTKVEDDEYVMQEVNTDIKPGDLFQIGEHRLLCGDSTKPEDVARLMGGKIADLVFTDPDFSMDIDLVKICYVNAVKYSKGVSFWVCADKQAAQLAMNDFDNFARYFVQDFRLQTIVSNAQPMTRHVMICQFGKRAMNNLHDAFSTVLQISTDRTSDTHKDLPMSKKPELPGAFISHYSQEGEIVLDLFAHSGSTMIAAHQLGRKCYAQEIEPKYCQHIINRIRKLEPDIKIKQVKK